MVTLLKLDHSDDLWNANERFSVIWKSRGPQCCHLTSSPGVSQCKCSFDTGVPLVTGGVLWQVGASGRWHLWSFLDQLVDTGPADILTMPLGSTCCVYRSHRSPQSCAMYCYKCSVFFQRTGFAAPNLCSEYTLKNWQDNSPSCCFSVFANC